MSQNNTSLDPRGLRFGAAVTSVVLVAVILAPAGVKEALLLIQVGLFALGAFIGPTATPQSKFYAAFVRPRIGAPTETEDSRPPQFAQAFESAGRPLSPLRLFAGFSSAALVLVGFALAAALLNAATGFCLGCEMYLITRRLAKQFV